MPQQFPNYPSFNPHYAPLEILTMGAFGGTAYNKISQFKRLGKSIVHDIASLGAEKVGKSEYDGSVNFFTGTTAYVRRYDSEIPDNIRLMNPGGWFYWYMLFFYGRSDNVTDSFRVKQWKDEIRSIMFYVKKACNAENKPLTDLTVEAAKVYRQHALQFGYDSTVDPNIYLK